MSQELVYGILDNAITTRRCVVRANKGERCRNYTRSQTPICVMHRNRQPVTTYHIEERSDKVMVVERIDLHAGRLVLPKSWVVADRRAILY